MANSILYGVYQLKDYQNQRAIDIAPDDLRRATILSAAAYNQQVQSLINLFARPTTSYKVRFSAAANARLQPGDQYARALAVKRSTYDVALPLQMGTHAWGVNYVTRYKRTVADDAKDTNLAFQADQNWMADHILGALFYNGAGWTFTDEQYGALTINGLANGDAILYSRQGGVPATDNHYLAQAAAIADATNPYPTIFTALMEHPENQGAEIISFIRDTTTTEALATFRPLDDPFVREADTLSVVEGELNANHPGTLRGRVGSQWVVQWPRLPANYIVSVAVGGIPPLAMRQDPEAELQGFRLGGQIDHYPYFEQQWFRRAGFGSWNRVGACITRVGNGSYAIPTGYGSPMP
jgi:hypothetical protein